ncbi:hypothetical protein ACFY2G_23020 [Streptomyces collinus]|uniref:hypothetical protein n=1 Tax=Streptomyces collinus TaxID=42684 RepID=UPI0036AF4F2E
MALQHDHTVLVNMQQALGLVVPAVAPRPGPDDGAVVPSPRKRTAGTATAEKSPAKKATATKAPAEKSAPATKSPADKATATKTPADKATASATGTGTATKATTDKATTDKAINAKATNVKATATKAPAVKSAAKRAPARKSTVNKAAGKKATGEATAAKAARPTLIDLVLKHLTGQQEPRSAAEVAQALDREHPERGVQATVVRTSLENLVAKNKAQRTKQGTSVFYTAGAVTD